MNISLNDSSSLSFFNVYAPPICSSPKDSRTNSFTLCGTEATLFFSAGQVCLSFSAEACAILQALCWVSPAPTSLPLFFSFYLILALSSPLCPLLYLSLYLNLWQELSSFSSCSFRLQWVPGNSFLPCNNSADELARPGALLVLSAIPCSLSSLISRFHSSLSSE